MDTFEYGRPLLVPGMGVNIVFNNVSKFGIEVFSIRGSNQIMRKSVGESL